MDAAPSTAAHVLRNTSETLEITFSAGDADGVVTYSAVDASGAVVQAGNATNDAAAGKYTFVLLPQAAVKSLTVTWAGAWTAVAQSARTFAEVVGGHLFSLADARTFDKAVLASTTTYTDAKIREARAGMTDLFEEVTGVSFVPRYGRETLDSPSSYDLWLSRREVRTLLAGSVDGVALTAPEIADVQVYETGRLFREAMWYGSDYRRSIVVAYEHGYQGVPFDAHHEALVYLRYLLVPSDVSDRTISYSNELGTFRQSVPGTKYPTGLPSVDAMLSRYSAPKVLA